MSWENRPLFGSVSAARSGVPEYKPTSDEKKLEIQALKDWKIAKEHAKENKLPIPPRPRFKNNSGEATSLVVPRFVPQEQKPLIVNDPVRLDDLLKKAESRVGMARPDPDTEFRGAFNGMYAGYSDENINADIKSVIDIKNEIAKTQTFSSSKEKKISWLIEALLIDLVNREQVLGDVVEMYPASEFDDLTQKVDAILFFKPIEHKNVRAIGIDITFSQDSKIIQKKISYSVDAMTFKGANQQGHLPHIKYATSSDEKPIPMFIAPRVIVAVPLNIANRLLELWESGNHTALKNSNLTQLACRQILLQLEELAQYANEINRPKIAAHLVSSLDLFKKQIIDKIPEKSLSYPEREESNCQNEIMHALKKAILEAKKNLAYQNA